MTVSNQPVETRPTPNFQNVDLVSYLKEGAEEWAASQNYTLEEGESLAPVVKRDPFLDKKGRSYFRIDVFVVKREGQKVVQSRPGAHRQVVFPGSRFTERFPEMHSIALKSLKSVNDHFGSYVSDSGVVVLGGKSGGDLDARDAIQSF